MAEDPVRSGKLPANIAEVTHTIVQAAQREGVASLREQLDLGVDLNAYSSGFYTHATPLHHAVCSGSLDAVKVLVEAGAELGTRDKAENATPLGWAEYLR